jgi:hypothetical protein
MIVLWTVISSIDPYGAKCGDATSLQYCLVTVQNALWTVISSIDPYGAKCGDVASLQYCLVTVQNALFVRVHFK